MRLRHVKGAKELIENNSQYITNISDPSFFDFTKFKHKQDIHIEIGMGKGQFIYQLAKNNPNINYIGIEKFDSVIVRALEKLILEPVDNLYLLRMDAEDLTSVFEAKTIDRIYLNFSDPWPKGKHEKRRLTHHNYLNRYLEVLKPQGELHFKTDNTDLFNYSVESITTYPMDITYITYDLHNTNFEGNIMTEFEEKFHNLGQKIHKLTAQFKEVYMDKLYRDLVDLPGAPSFEKQVRNYMRENLIDHVEEIIEDKLGSIFGIINKGSKGPRVMLAGHMDEVGAIVTGFDKHGLIKMTNLGGMHGDVFLSQHMDIILDDQTKIPGVTASKPPHLSRGSNDTPKKIEFTELLLDIGADNIEHAKELGVKIGQQIIPRNNYTVSKDGKKIFSKAWDDRFGCGISLEMAKEISKENIDCEFYVGATVQEEVGLRGAGTAANMIRPDVFLAVDCSPCADVFGGDEIGGTIGNGFLVRFYDPSAIMHQGMKKYITELAEKNNVKFQYYKSMGGTDAAKVQLANDGVLVATIGMPARYIHSTTSMISIDDYQEVKKIVKLIIESMNSEVVDKIKADV